MSQLSQALAVVLARLTTFDAGAGSVAECAALVEVLVQVEKACAAARAAAAVRTGKRADEVALLCGRTRAEVARELETVAQVRELPVTDDALHRGELSLAQAHEIAMTVAVCPDVESAMVATAKTSSLQVLRDEGRRRRLAAIDPDVLRERQVAARSHRQWTDELGMVRYSGAMLPEHGVPFAHRVDIETDRRWRAARRNGTVIETREQLAADAVAEIVAGGGRAHAVRADVVYVCDVNTGATRVVGGAPVPRAVFDEAAREGFVKAVLHDGTKIDTIVHYGRRALPALVRTAIELGDPPDFDGIRCVDCGRVLGLQYDHVDPVANGGPTCAANLRPRCCTCHEVKTEGDRAAGLLTPSAGRSP